MGEKGSRVQRLALPTLDRCGEWGGGGGGVRFLGRFRGKQTSAHWTVYRFIA